MFVFDGGVMLGASVKVRIGVMEIVELVGDPVLTASDDSRKLGVAPPTPAGASAPALGTPALQVASGTQFFLGPIVGLHFGD